MFGVLFGASLSVSVSVGVSKSMVENVGISVNTGVSSISTGMSKSVGNGNVSPDMSVMSDVFCGAVLMSGVCLISILLKIDVCDWPM